ncbi:MAG: hypothetical protein ACK4WH_06020 [Phycisphaerales bacterium]
MLAVIVATLYAAALCSAQAAHHIGAIAYRLEQWQYKPVYTVTQDRSLARVEAIVAFRDPVALTGNNISVVLYERQAAPSNSWTAKAWQTTDTATIIAELKALYHIPNCEDWLWEVKEDFQIQAAVAAGPPEYSDKGFLGSDPISTALPPGELRALLLDTLTIVGYKSAVPTIEDPTAAGTVCRDTQLGAFADSTEAFLMAAGDDDDRIAASFSALAAAPPIAPGEPCREEVPGNANPCLLIHIYAPFDFGERVCGGWATIPWPNANVQIKTCFVRNCAQLQRSTVLVTKRCVTPWTKTVGYLYRAVTYTEGCCVWGIAGPPPPLPCLAELDDILPRPWQPTVPSVP